MDMNYLKRNRSPILVRKIVTREGEKLGRGGIYYQNGDPAPEIREGGRYKAKLGGEPRDVVAGPRQIMYLLEDVGDTRIRENSTEDMEEPRVRATLAQTRATGFDLAKGTYRYPK